MPPLAPTPVSIAATRRPVRERALAWLYTGPLGHLYSALADIVVALTRWLASLAWQRLRAAAASRRN